MFFFFFNDTATTEIYTLSYTTLFRSRRTGRGGHVRRARVAQTPGVATNVRSEEHTSELQSLTNIVCRLLLEKKKENQKRQYRCIRVSALHIITKSKGMKKNKGT